MDQTMNFSALVIVLDIDQLMFGTWLRGYIPDAVFDFGNFQTDEIKECDMLVEDIEREQYFLMLRNVHVTYQKNMKVALFMENLVDFICSLSSIMFCLCMFMYTLTFIYY